eukprot:CAMPEP_0113559698 /NCGR_PEP_ID=MMETSP0015_2-20120614/19036_1 /TAXON_ID=2838 /ORGANISM="Odontella" /LENGTH=572 /DNA_ID=CAMNT_0000461353 /DNA_START=50 /DNA_END=1765 /DNA_ORIENTATION=- /assembly_acc=CAM_ASM_000160
MVLQKCSPLFCLLTLLSCAFAKSSTTAETAEKQNYESQCQGVTGDDDDGIETFTADVVLVGSGPAGAGFLHRLVRLRPDLSVIWIEKGLDFKAINWPLDIIEDTDTDVLTEVPRKKLTHISGKAWNNFGGGDAANSGGANYLVSAEPYPPLDVFALRNNSIIPGTETSDRWTKAFETTGFEKGPPPSIKKDDKDLVSLPSSLRSEDGRSRLLLADDLRYSTVNRNIRYVHGRAASVIRVDEGSRAIGVRGVRLDNKQNEYGGCVAWKANLAVVLSGGIFNTFDLLVETGIGQKKHLETRKVPIDWWTPNENVGTQVGDEHAVVYVGVEPEAADPFGAQPRLIAEDLDGSAYEFWTKGLETWLAVKTIKTYYIAKVMAMKTPGVVRVMKWFLRGSSMWAIGIFAEPILELDAISKPLNATQRREWFLDQPPFSGSLVTMIKKRLNYKSNRLGILVDDSKLEVTEEMCKAITRAMEPMKEGGRLQNAVKDGQSGTRMRRFLLKALTKLSIVKLLKPNLATYWNADSFTGGGKQCNTNMFASYYHYYGGNAKVVDDSYQVKGTKNLYIADASVLT